ncbi:MAG: hypothetical protein QE271_14065 [Bacteriovoracaceae bacterium]|nr:hypothetical protein [Bacteriovoracaceae bacterium]
MGRSMAIKKFIYYFLGVGLFLISTSKVLAGYSDEQMARERFRYMKNVCKNGIEPEFIDATPVTDDDQKKDGQSCVTYTWTCKEGTKNGAKASGGSDLVQTKVVCKTADQIFTEDDGNGNNNNNHHNDNNCDGGEGNCGGTTTVDIATSGMCFGNCGPCADVCGKYLSKGKGLFGGRWRKCRRCFERFKKVSCLANLDMGGSCGHSGRTFVCTRCNEQPDCANGAGSWCDPGMDDEYVPRKKSRRERRRDRRADRRYGGRYGGSGEEYCEDCERTGRRRSGKFWDFLGKVVEVGVPVAAGVYTNKLGLDNCRKLYETYSGYKANAGETIPAPNCQGNALNGFSGFNNPGIGFGYGLNGILAVNGGGNLQTNLNPNFPLNTFNNVNNGQFFAQNGHNNFIGPQPGSWANGANGFYLNANAGVGNPFGYNPYGASAGFNPFGQQGFNPYGVNQPFNNFNGFGNGQFNPWGVSAQDVSIQRSFPPGRTIGGNNFNQQNQFFQNGFNTNQLPGGLPSYSYGQSGYQQNQQYSCPSGGQVGINC